MSNNYIIGRMFEYRVKKQLEKHGYVVFRTAGSHSPADLVALKRGVVVLVQCKYRKGGAKIRKKEVMSLDRLVDELECAGYVAFNDKNGHIHFVFVRDLEDEDGKR